MPAKSLVMQAVLGAVAQSATCAPTDGLKATISCHRSSVASAGVHASPPPTADATVASAVRHVHRGRRRLGDGATGTTFVAEPRGAGRCSRELSLPALGHGAGSPTEIPDADDLGSADPPAGRGSP